MARLRPTVLVADDHPTVLDQVRLLLEPDFEIVGAAASGPELLSEAGRLHPDLIVTDVAMPGMSGLEASGILLARDPDTRIVLLTIHGDDEIASSAFRIGVRGFVLKIKAGEELAAAVRAVLAGETFRSDLAVISGCKKDEFLRY